MKRLVAVLTIAGATALSGVGAAAPVSADPSLCLHVDIDIQGQGDAQTVCLPPEGSEPPALPGLPTLPGLSGFGI